MLNPSGGTYATAIYISENVNRLNFDVFLNLLNTELADALILADKGIAHKTHSRKSPNIVVTAVRIVDKSDTVCKQNSVLLES